MCAYVHRYSSGPREISAIVIALASQAGIKPQSGMPIVEREHDSKELEAVQADLDELHQEADDSFRRSMTQFRQQGSSIFSPGGDHCTLGLVT